MMDLWKIADRIRNEYLGMFEITTPFGYYVGNERFIFFLRDDQIV